MIEQLRIGAHVFSSDSKQVGTLSRIVVTGNDLVVTGLVVDPGAHLSELLEPGSLDKLRDRSVPVALAHVQADASIHLTCDAAAFARLPLFERRQYQDAPVEPGGSRFRVGELVNYLASTFGLGAAPFQPDNDEITFDMSADSAAIPVRAPVWRTDPHEVIGVVERTLADEATQRITALVIRRNSMDDQLVIVSADAITSFADGVAHVALTDEELDHLPPYTGDNS
jgi:sporulation protein YlmC with PRC-barrel domain